MNTLVNYHCVDFATGKLYVKDANGPRYIVHGSPVTLYGEVRGPLDLVTFRRALTRVIGVQHGLCKVVHAVQGSGTMTMLGSCVFAEDVVKHAVVAVLRDKELIYRLLATWRRLGLNADVSRAVIERALVAWEPEVVRYNPDIWDIIH